MSILRYDEALQALLLLKGHPYDRKALSGLFESDPSVVVTAVEHPAAQHFLAPEAAQPYDALVFYDMPGIDFAKGSPPGFVEPSRAVREGFEALLERGKGMVFLHHAVAGWPSWERYAEVMGARFLYAPAEIGRRSWPDSGYRHDVRHRLTPVDPGHPVAQGLDQGFELTDELYLCPIFEDRVEPLFRSDARFEDEAFYSSAEALRGRMHSREGWSHPPGSDLAVWCRQEGRSRIVTILGGDGPPALSSPAFGRLVMNAIRFVAEPAA